MRKHARLPQFELGASPKPRARYISQPGLYAPNFGRHASELVANSLTFHCFLLAKKVTGFNYRPIPLKEKTTV